MLDAVREIIVERGVANCSVEAVAARSGVAKTTIYRHFGRLDDLVFAAVARDVSNTVTPDTGTLRGDLIEIQRHYVEVAQSATVRELFLWMAGRAAADPSLAELFRRVRIQPRGPTMIALKRAIARGELDPSTDLDMAMHMIQGPFISMRIIDNADIDSDEIETMVDMAVRALTG